MTPQDKSQLPAILPLGTAVVSKVEFRGGDGKPRCPRGSVGLITRAPGDPEHRYRVRFAGGQEASLRRSELTVLTSFQRRGMAGELDPMMEHDLYRYVIFRCVIGSRAYGLDHEESLHEEFDAAYEKTELPPHPDYEKANDLLVKARRSMVT